jgi:uncharacterized membrane protein YozB (DUF420 family)
MDPKLWFWTAALIDLTAVAALAARGVRHVRRGDVARHRRCMTASAALVFLFLFAYAGKLWLLGRENLAVWSPGDVLVLHVHETCVAVMLAGGALAGQRAWRMRRTRRVTGDPASPVTPRGWLRLHRGAGWAAVVAAGLGWATAGLVLLGMYRRTLGG